MNDMKIGASAVADLSTGEIVASVEIAEIPERVFRALASEEITGWWVRPGVFDTREWTGDVRVGGRWRAAGLTRGQPYVQEGEFLEIDSPRRLVHTWNGVGQPEAPSTATYVLEPMARSERESRCGMPASRRATPAAPSPPAGRRASVVLRKSSIGSTLSAERGSQYRRTDRRFRSSSSRGGASCTFTAIACSGRSTTRRMSCRKRCCARGEASRSSKAARRSATGCIASRRTPV